MHKKNSFQNFTNLYALSKTLRFELKPVDNTQQMLEEEKVVEKDATIKKKYENTKPYFDKLHREFVQEALSEAQLTGLDEYFELFMKWKKDQKKYQQELNKKEKKLRENVVEFFDIKARDWVEKYSNLGLKKKNKDFLFEENIFAVLRERYHGKENTEVEDERGELVSIFDSWKDFVCYFKKFFETRKNFYKADGTSTALATRIVDQNLKRFCENILIFQDVEKKIDWTELEEKFDIRLSDVFNVQFYNKCLLQNGIDSYSKIIGGETLNDGEKITGINELINLYRQKNKEKLPFLKELDKQILSAKEQFIDEIEDDEMLQAALKSFQEIAKEKTNVLEKLFADFVKNNEEYNLSNVYISKEAFNTISRRWTKETELFEKLLFDVLNKKEVREWYEIKKTTKDPKIGKDERGYTFPSFIQLAHLKEALELLPKDLSFWKDKYYIEEECSNRAGCLSDEKRIWKQFLKILDFEFSSLFEKQVVDKETNRQKTVGYYAYDEKLNKIIKDYRATKEEKMVIKDFADQVLNIYQMAKYFALEKKRKWMEEYETEDFYENPKFGYKLFYENAYEGIVQTYNKVRNYLTKKPYNQGKWKLNFDNSTLADGWDKNKESDNCAVILRRKEKYYLGIMKKNIIKYLMNVIQKNF